MSTSPALSFVDAVVEEDPGDVRPRWPSRRARTGCAGSADRLAERLAVLGVVQAQSEHALAGGDRDRRDRDPLLGQVLHQGDEARSPPRRAGSPWAPATLSKNSSAVSWALRPILSRLRPRSKPGHPALDDEQADALVAGVRVGARDHDHEVGEDAVADERLGAVEHVVVALVDGGGADALQVRAGARLGHRDRGDQLAADQPGQPAPLLLVGRQRADVGRRSRRCGPGTRARWRPARVISSVRTTL